MSLVHWPAQPGSEQVSFPSRVTIGRPQDNGGGGGGGQLLTLAIQQFSVSSVSRTPSIERN